MQAFDDELEELNDPSSEEDSESRNGGQDAKTVDATTAQSADTSRDSESMIVAIELGNRENLEVRANEVMKRNDEQMIVAIHLNNPQELRVKEAEAKQDEPNSLGTWSQEQPSEGTVPQATSGLLRLAKCAKDTTANVCEAAPSGQLASKGQETEQKMEVETKELPAPMTGDCDISQTAGGEPNTAGASEEGAPIPPLSPCTAPEMPSECPPPVSQDKTSREDALKPAGSPKDVSPGPAATATVTPSTSIDVPPCLPLCDAPVDSGCPPLATVADDTQLGDATRLTTPHSSTTDAQRAAGVEPGSDRPLLAEHLAPREACDGTSNTLDGGGEVVGHGEEVSLGGAEGQIDVDVVVYAEEDEFSMFSTEADELQKFSAHGKYRVPASSSGSSSHGQVASSRDRKNGDNSQADVVPELGQARKRDIAVEVGGCGWFLGDILITAFILSGFAAVCRKVILLL